jgi:hypothetical protein
VPFRLVYLSVSNALALLRLLPMSERGQDAEILALRHQTAVLQRQLHGAKVRFTPADRALLAVRTPSNQDTYLRRRGLGQPASPRSRLGPPHRPQVPTDEATSLARHHTDRQRVTA